MKTMSSSLPYDILIYRPVATIPGNMGLKCGINNSVWIHRIKCCCIGWINAMFQEFQNRKCKQMKKQLGERQLRMMKITHLSDAMPRIIAPNAQPTKYSDVVNKV